MHCLDISAAGEMICPRDDVLPWFTGPLPYTGVELAALGGHRHGPPRRRPRHRAQSQGTQPMTTFTFILAAARHRWFCSGRCRGHRFLTRPWRGEKPLKIQKYYG